MFGTRKYITTSFAQRMSQTPSHDDLVAARSAFEVNEPRDLFYRAATELVDLALRKQTHLTVAEALAVLLQTWNAAYYRFRPFDGRHFTDIERVLRIHEKVIMAFRDRVIEAYDGTDQETIEEVFGDFEDVLGPVGAAKCLHLLAPRFFPLWDRAIAQAYRLALKSRGKNAIQYVKFVELTKHQAKQLGGEQVISRNPLKALDEYNYCKYTKRWL